MDKKVKDKIIDESIKEMDGELNDVIKQLAKKAYDEGYCDALSGRTANMAFGWHDSNIKKELNKI